MAGTIESSFVETAYGRFHVEVTGQGKPVLFIHGGVASAREWRWVLPDLGEHARCFAIDRLGCGESDPCRGGYDRTNVTRSLLACADALGLDRFGLVGQSFGGFWSYSMTFAAPERVSRLVIVNSASSGPMTDEEIRQRRERQAARRLARVWAEMPDSERDAEVDSTIRTIFAEPNRVPAHYRDYLRWQLSVAVPGQLEAVAGEMEQMGRERYDRITCPALIVWGEADSTNLPDRGRRMAAAIPGARYAGLPGVGHTCQIEDPAGFVAAVAPFLDATSAGA